MKKRQKLNFTERELIERFLNKGYTQKAIAQKLKRSTSTISKEIKRNSIDGDYRCGFASMISRQRLSEMRSKPRTFTVALKQQVKLLLKKDFSPEQISGRLKLSGIAISHETIYQWIWKNKALKGKLYLYLKRRGRSYKRRGAIYQNRGMIKDRVDIDLRPNIVDERRRVGDWEVDCIVGKAHKGAIVSMVDRKTRLVKLVLVKDRTANRVALALIKGLKRQKVSTITSDNGKEFAKHKHVSNALNADFYFAKPYSAWQRGTNENTNGLVRQFLPKGSDFTTVTQKQVKGIEHKLNNRPRKCLGYLSPKEYMRVAMV
tara:strand:- start:30 stop:980 length:951 start_codon:yes stop_codon:yes gene_type:complete